MRAEWEDGLQNPSQRSVPGHVRGHPGQQCCTGDSGNQEGLTHSKCWTMAWAAITAFSPVFPLQFSLRNEGPQPVSEGLKLGDYQRDGAGPFPACLPPAWKNREGVNDKSSWRKALTARRQCGERAGINIEKEKL